MPWQQITVATNQQLVELVETTFETFDALSVTITDGADQPLYEPPPETTPLWERVLITGLFEQDSVPKNIEKTFQHALAQSNDWVLSVEQLEDQVWERVWLENFQPIKFGQHFWVCATEHQPPIQQSDVVLRLDPGLAFGTGTHPTTALCLAWLANHPFHNQRVFDFGCGSGILAISALLLGASEAVGIDIDPQALIASQQNAQSNHVANKLTCFNVIDYPQAPNDIVMANILSEPLIELSPKITALVKPTGDLLLSGILCEQIHDVIEAYKSDFKFSPPMTKDNWACLHARKKA